ncbi:hypothetical protein BDD12DRAFT_143776 [Trichophaea hybrida]|nr:hypothetical protein BDD12DRAFT_143776 [Trichophaea hybrida]
MQEQQMLVSTYVPILWLLGATYAMRESLERGFLWYSGMLGVWNVCAVHKLPITAHLCVCTRAYSYRRLAIFFLRNREYDRYGGGCINVGLHHHFYHHDRLDSCWLGFTFEEVKIHQFQPYYYTYIPLR